nr:immunoglobulin light chain junction region [Macaca mulatta]
CQQYNILPFTF